MKHRIEMPLGRFSLSLETGHMPSRPTAPWSSASATRSYWRRRARRRSRGPASTSCLSRSTIAENTYAGGKIPGASFKREGRPSEKEILTLG